MPWFGENTTRPWSGQVAGRRDGGRLQPDHAVPTARPDRYAIRHDMAGSLGIASWYGWITTYRTMVWPVQTGSMSCIGP